MCCAASCSVSRARGASPATRWLGRLPARQWVNAMGRLQLAGEEPPALQRLLGGPDVEQCLCGGALAADLQEAGHELPTQMLKLMTLLEKEGPVFSDRLLVTIRGGWQLRFAAGASWWRPWERRVVVDGAGAMRGQERTLGAQLAAVARRACTLPGLLGVPLQAWRTAGWCTRLRAAPPRCWTPSATSSCGPWTARPRHALGLAAAAGLGLAASEPGSRLPPSPTCCSALPVPFAGGAPAGGV